MSESNTNSPPVVDCPYCGERLEINAVECPQCQAPLNRDRGMDRGSGALTVGLILVVSIPFALVLAIVVYCTSWF